MAIQHWSTTAADNDDADATINWAEGQAASSVNNSGRAMMAVVAAYRDALGGAKTSGGSSNAYTLTTGLSLASYQNGLLLGFEANHTNTGAATIDIDSIGAKDLKTTAGAALSAGQIVSGGIYLIAYESGADDVLLLNPIPAAAAETASLEFIIDGGGAAISTGIKGDLEIPFGCTITRATMVADQTGSIVVDVWVDTYANFPPSDADSITASAPLTISSGTKTQDTTLTGWGTSLASGSIMRFNVDSCTTTTRVTVSLFVTKA